MTSEAIADALQNDLATWAARIRVPAVLPDTTEAADAWDANCGPMSLAAVLGLPTVQAVRPLVDPFRGFMSPTDMLRALAASGHKHRVVPIDWPQKPLPQLGLLRVQWHGSWLNPGVDKRAAYRYTHWIGVRAAVPVDGRRLDETDRDAGAYVYDATPNRWIPLQRWIPWAPVLYPRRANGWSFATAIEVTPR